MADYSPYATTVVGVYSVPRWYEALEREVEAGGLSRADMEDAQVAMPRSTSRCSPSPATPRWRRWTPSTWPWKA